jgi:hypothetical protein
VSACGDRRNVPRRSSAPRTAHRHLDPAVGSSVVAEADDEAHEGEQCRSHASQNNRSHDTLPISRRRVQQPIAAATWSGSRVCAVSAPLWRSGHSSGARGWVGGMTRRPWIARIQWAAGQIAKPCKRRRSLCVPPLALFCSFVHCAKTQTGLDVSPMSTDRPRRGNSSTSGTDCSSVPPHTPGTAEHRHQASVPTGVLVFHRGRKVLFRWRRQVCTWRQTMRHRSLALIVSRRRTSTVRGAAFRRGQSRRQAPLSFAAMAQCWIVPKS